ncbi:unnamed protein product [Nippostrongylus brasiliensis]|uniref:Protein tyrosine phosphatase type IVA 3 n=1 Tax=Nippostrongylus brasiliensis TaxID=27835 RepID=A0A0N4Y5R0_NIPBR|nr:unnamed protein product [Nippostrongylus brasiliensis]
MSTGLLLWTSISRLSSPKWALQRLRSGFRLLALVRPTLNRHHLKFCMGACGSSSLIDQELDKHSARAVVRVCEPTYATKPLRDHGIDVLDWEFSDGSPPPPELVRASFKEHPEHCIAVHCVAGLGRAPVLVALALIEAGMKYEDAVELIRRQRRGALNQKQLNFLEKYKPTGELRKLRYSVDGKQKSCVIM